MAEWQLVHPRLKSRMEFSSVGVVGCRLASWQVSHTRGIRTLSNCGLLVPCGSWQVAQFSSTGGWFHRNGPRRSVWQLRQFSFVVACSNCLGLGEPCGLWQLEQLTFPSRYGICYERCSCARRIWWQVRHSSGSSFFNVCTSLRGELKRASEERLFGCG